MTAYRVKRLRASTSAWRCLRWLRIDPREAVEASDVVRVLVVRPWLVVRLVVNTWRRLLAVVA